MIKKICFVIWTCRKKLDWDDNPKMMTILTYLLGLILLFLGRVGLGEAAKCFPAFMSCKDLLGLNIEDMLYTQISITFIVITLTSILSSNVKIVYWMDKVELELINPVFTSFSAYTMYIFACLTMSFVWTLYAKEYVWLSFLLSIVVMSFLTLKMVNVYFGSNKVKQKMEWYFEWQKKNAKQEYEETLNKMIYITVKYSTENDIHSFFENMDFLYKHGEFETMHDVIKLTGANNIVIIEQLTKRLLEKEANLKTYENLLVIDMGTTFGNIKGSPNISSGTKQNIEIICKTWENLD